jgi:molecular chaperone DnaJ
VQPGADALVRVDLDLTDTAFGGEQDIIVDTALLCPACNGDGCAPGTKPETCPTCHGQGEVQQIARSFLGQVITSRPCSRCRGTGSIIPSPCTTCGAEGRVRSRRTLTVTIPAGVADGMRIRLTGEGEVGPGGGRPGDLYLEVHEREHPVFSREGDDLHCEVHLPMTAAALGTSVSLPTLDGEEKLTVRPGTQPGHVVTLHARGVPHLHASGRGDLHVHVKVDIPTRLDAEQERLLRDLAKLRGEENPAATPTTADGQGLFSRLRDAFR